MANWQINTNEVNVNAMAEALKVSPVLAHILANRGIKTKKAAIRYLNPILDYEHDVLQLKDADKAAKIVLKAISKKVKITIFGDYDVDGVVSTTILYKTLKNFGAIVEYYIPDREKEGYGLNTSAIEELAKNGTKLVIACDNGISAAKPIELAKELAMAVIIIDHHEPRFLEDNGGRTDILPCAAAIVDPKQMGCEYPFRHLCAGGLSYKFSKHINSLANREFKEEDEFLILAALATHCDIVDLTDENRIITKNGAKRLNTGLCTNIGLNALLRVREIIDKTIGTFDFGFIIGPCINASGRLKNAKLAVELFVTDNFERANEIAAELVILNDKRKSLTNDAVEQTLLELNKTEISTETDSQNIERNIDKVIVIFNPEIHESIAGIVAGKIKEKYNHPTIVFTRSNDFIKGSARSIQSCNIFEELYKCRDLFTTFGGHAMAAGLSMPEKNFDELKKRLNSSCILEEEDFVKIIEIEKEILLDDITFALAKELLLLEPFGKENEEPVFCTRGIFTDQIDILGKNRQTLRFTFSVDGVRKIKAICFSKMDEFMALLRNSYSEKICDSFFTGAIKRLTVKMDIAYTIDINEYNGDASVQLKILDFKF